MYTVKAFILTCINSVATCWLRGRITMHLSKREESGDKKRRGNKHESSTVSKLRNILEIFSIQITLN